METLPADVYISWANGKKCIRCQMIYGNTLQWQCTCMRIPSIYTCIYVSILHICEASILIDVCLGTGLCIYVSLYIYICNMHATIYRVQMYTYIYSTDNEQLSMHGDSVPISRIPCTQTCRKVQLFGCQSIYTGLKVCIIYIQSCAFASLWIIHINEMGYNCMHIYERLNHRHLWFKLQCWTFLNSGGIHLWGKQAGSRLYHEKSLPSTYYMSTMQICAWKKGVTHILRTS